MSKLTIMGFRTVRALASAPAGNAEKLAELSIDKHHGVAAHKNRANVYTVKLDKLDPAMRYFIVASIRGVSQFKQKPGRTGCNGLVWMEAAMPEDWRQRVESARPLTDEDLAAKQASRFTGKGLRVGVLQGGYGSQGILKGMRNIEGMDVQPLEGLYPIVLERCQVVVLPQPKGASMGPETVKTLEKFVSAGGGLVTTHDAVGYRGLPRLLTSICARGIAHVRDAEWVPVGEHPITEGIKPDQPHPHAYYDHIELEPGPQGAVVAKAAKSGRPVIVSGSIGKGRYMACGLAIGLNAKTEDEPPTGAEMTMFLNALRWCGGDGDDR
ncbi:MAG: hypothetical protein QGF00_22550 [Planctomycetota bacterium]|jgi:hypothetical protein|nr:hypothetical protein [Planctomycetota bacterium]MDP7252408.1 hypothetical protein [Planctomycetota bacterium]